MQPAAAERVSTPLRRTLVFLAAAGAAVVAPAAPAAAHPLHAAAASSSWLDIAGRSAAGAVLLWATLPLGGLLLESLWASRGPRTSHRLADTALGVALVVAVAWLRHGGRGAYGLAFGITVVHLAAAAVWLGGVLDIALRKSEWQTTARRFGPAGIAAAGVLVVSGVWNVRLHTSGRPLAGTYEHVLVVKLLLVVAVLAVAGVVHRRLRPRLPDAPRRLVRGEAALLTAVVGAASLLAALPTAAIAADSGPIRIAAVADRVEVRTAGHVLTASGPDADECASVIVGAALGGGRPRAAACQAEAPDPTAIGTAFARFLADRGTMHLVILGDGSARSAAMTGAVADAAAA
ncbi:MAG: hypothetical protein JWP02_3050, partial [Acidimicrobiales bacterium]|nr:hypothetical protein [Acidimicrobiales bacterium]